MDKKKIQQKTFEQKEKHRKVLAALSYEEKIDILGKLQRIHNETRHKVDRQVIAMARARAKRA